METNLKLENGYAVLRVSGDLRLWDRRGAEQELLKLLPDDAALPGNRLLLNLADLTHVDSLGISALVRVVIACVKKSVGVGRSCPAALPANRFGRRGSLPPGRSSKAKPRR
jgi:Anti-anti-sigma regulatory factor (antagonist of anti-sigma factor)